LAAAGALLGFDVPVLALGRVTTVELPFTFLFYYVTGTSVIQARFSGHFLALAQTPAS
jgi:hypothetical protein